MLEPRESDIPALFLVLVVLPLVIYILLGIWSEVSKKKGRITVLAQLAAEEAFRAEAMAVALDPAPAPAPALAPATFVPLVPLQKNGGHECARCHGPATTRCARCKSVRYCSGKCQIIHWRQVHKQVCQQMEYSGCSSPDYSVSNNNENVLMNDESRCFGYSNKQPKQGKTPPEETSRIFMKERRSIEKHVSRKPKKEMSRREDGAILEPTSIPLTDAYMRHKIKESDYVPLEEELPVKNENILSGFSNGHVAPRSSIHDNHKSENKNALDSRNSSAKNGRSSHDIETELLYGPNLLRGGISSSDETLELKKSNKSKSYKSPKSTVKASREQSCLDMDKKGQIGDESKFGRTRDTTVLPQGNNGVTSMGIMKMIGLMRSSKPDRFDSSEINGDRHKKIKMLFPYEEFVKFFQCEVFDLSPRGLVNCGNSCYANAVLQCLMCTKPLTIYLLRRSHSRSCCGKDWCLMCELEQHVMMLRDSGGGPMSPGGILLHMRTLNAQIGGGNQEDAHEFLRLLVTSMQSICLESLGGENVVDPRLQETTFIQHAFGGRLRSKVKCLRCNHESERSENIMDLTLEIFGWVESLEDALTQFTSAEDLDGENMYRCGRCSAYVRAHKQLSIQEAPNILTIVLKRFQEGSYGKINKCITFPDMLDMIPFMTGTDDIPPLYMLYAVVVHLDTLNASFSGHYISYVKDLQGNWFRIDDTEVQSVPASQVMSEGAYILFYMRSCPRPARGKPTRQNAASFAKHWTSKTPPKSSKSGNSKSSCHFVNPEPSSDHWSLNSKKPPILESSRNVEFSDATSSDRSFFTSSDEASFTTESTRDSFSTVDYADATDPFSSLFSNLYAPPDYSSHKTVSCSKFPRSRPQSRFVSSEGKTSVMDSIVTDNSIYNVKYHSSKDGTHRTCCKL